MAYVFHPEQLHGIARKALGQPHEEMCRTVIDELTRLYPGHVHGGIDWIFNLAGGATGVMKILHASLSEYLIIFGTPVGTEAFSGRYRIDIHDFVLVGEMWTYLEETCTARVTSRPGDHAVLRAGQVKGFRLREDTWMLEYGRGPIVTSLPVALGDSIFSAMDWSTIVRTLAIYGRLTVKELLQGKI